MEPTSALGALGGAASEISKSGLAEKLLGPTAEYLGQHLRDMVERRLTNTGKIFQVAERRLGSRINNEGNVHPKVLKGILDDGSYAEDELAAEYFGGILASSRSGVSRDDRGAYFCSLVGRLNTYQLRSHYIFYSLFKAGYEDGEFNLTNDTDNRSVAAYISWKSYLEGMEFVEDEEFNAILGNIFFGLHREDLIGIFAYGNDASTHPFSSSPGPGIIVSPSALGAELFLWAHGLGNVASARFFHPDIQIQGEMLIPRAEDTFVTDAKKEQAKARRQQEKAAE